MKLKSYFKAALFVCLTLGLATSCKEKDPAKGFTLSKEELTIGVGQNVYVDITGNSTYSATSSNEEIVSVMVSGKSVFIKAKDKMGEAVVKVTDTKNTSDTKNIKVTVQKEVKPQKFTVQLDASRKKNWTYFSFATGQVVTVDKDSIIDSPKGLDWDVAFCRFYTRTNSGDSNSEKSGKGGALMTEVFSLEQAQIPEDDKFITDETGQLSPGMAVIVTSRNEELQKWLDVDISHMPPTYSIKNKNVFIIRCADGKTYAKVKFLGFENDEGKNIYPKFEYEYPFVRK